YPNNINLGSIIEPCVIYIISAYYANFNLLILLRYFIKQKTPK
ncbi:unnamed protein product, partial [marine sediment metagenome]